jgi:hypothetical protein
MRFVKHMTNSRRDPEIASLIAECGIEGYGFYWLLVEVVAEAMKGTDQPEATYPLTQWAHLLHSHHHRVSKYLGKLGVTPLVRVEYVEGKVRVIIPNILKIRDDHKANSPKSPTIDIELEKELEKEEEPPTPLQASDEALDSLHALRESVENKPAPKRKLASKPDQDQQTAWFSDWWPDYWRKDEKADAEKAFRKLVTSEQIYSDLRAATQRQTAEMLAREKKFRPLPATYLNRKPWLNEPEDSPQPITPQKPAVDQFGFTAAADRLFLELVMRDSPEFAAKGFMH